MTRKNNLLSWVWFCLSIYFIVVLLLVPGLLLYLASALLAREWGSFNSFVLDTVFAWALWYVTRTLLRRVR